MSLREYNSKRDFKATPEPKGVPDKSDQQRFVVSRHQARRLHYDFRLEMDGVLKSWAVPKGPSMNSAEKRFAVMTEDHPVAYLGFKGIIPEGHYGAGIMEIWDQGNYMAVDEDMNPISNRAAAAALKKGELKIFLKGTHIQGGYVLIRLKADDKNWLLIKHNDEYNIRKAYDAEKHIPVSRKTRPGNKTAKKGKEVAAKKKEKKIAPNSASEPKPAASGKPAPVAAGNTVGSTAGKTKANPSRKTAVKTSAKTASKSPRKTTKSLSKTSSRKTV